jgi:hypothetical protein
MLRTRHAGGDVGKPQQRSVKRLFHAG